MQNKQQGVWCHLHAFVFEIDKNLQTLDCAQIIMQVAQTRNRASREKNSEREYALFYSMDNGKTLLAMDGIYYYRTTKENVLREYEKVTPVGTMKFISSWVGDKTLRYKPVESMPTCMAESSKNRRVIKCKGSQIPTKTAFFRGQFVFLFREDKKYVLVVRKGREGKKDLISFYGREELNQYFWVVEDCNYISQWRYYIYNGKIQCSRNFRGDKSVRPDESVVNASIQKICASNEYPPSFVLDIGVTDAEGKEPSNTLVMGAAPFLCCRLFGAYSEAMTDMAEASFVMQ